jgi:hypothetical protein
VTDEEQKKHRWQRFPIVYSSGSLNYIPYRCMKCFFEFRHLYKLRVNQGKELEWLMKEAKLPNCT